LSVLNSILGPLDSIEPESAPPSPDVTFKVGDIVVIYKLGWCGTIKIAEIRGEHVRAATAMKMFDQDRAVWFHHTELRAVKETKE